MAEREPSKEFYTKLDNFVGVCSKGYINKDYQNEISSFNSSYYWTWSRSSKLEENFKKKEVQDEFDTLLTAILGSPVKASISSSSGNESRFPSKTSTSSPSKATKDSKGDYSKFEQSKPRIFVTGLKIPKCVIRGKEYKFGFDFILDRKDQMYSWDIKQIEGDNLRISKVNKGAIKQYVEKSVEFYVTFEKENKTGVYSFAIVDSYGKTINASKPIQEEITVIDGPVGLKKNYDQLEVKDIRHTKTGRNVEVRFKVCNTYGSKRRDFHVEVLGNEVYDTSPKDLYVPNYKDFDAKVLFTLNGDSCNFLMFTLIEKDGKDKKELIKSPIEIDLTKKTEEKAAYIHSLPEVPEYGKEITGVLSIKNNSYSPIYKGWYLKPFGSDTPVEGLEVLEGTEIGSNERKNFLFRFTITEPPKYSQLYKFSILDKYKIPKGEASIEFKNIEGNSVTKHKKANEIKPKKIAGVSFYKGKINGSWTDTKTIVKEMTFGANFRVLNNGGYSWPKNIKLVYVSGDPIYDFTYDTSGVSGLGKDKSGYVYLKFKIDNQVSDKYKFDLVDDSGRRILIAPLEITVKLCDKLGAYFPPEKVAPQSDDSKIDHPYNFHSKEEIERILGIKH